MDDLGQTIPGDSPHAHFYVRVGNTRDINYQKLLLDAEGDGKHPPKLCMNSEDCTIVLLVFPLLVPVLAASSQLGVRRMVTNFLKYFQVCKFHLAHSLTLQLP